METIHVHDKMQQNYSYKLTQPMGENFDPEFQPHLTPKQMLEIGVFGGKYMTDCQDEFPVDRWENAKLSPFKKNPKINFFGVDASLSLKYWQEKGRIYHEDPRGWFQRYCRYYMGRRCPDDTRQIKRRKAIKRHWMALVKNCHSMDRDCRTKQRQALLHRAYDSRKI
ncbi:MAG TPA: hypothetical protein P5060_02375 [Candidatus Absconditabacterales bacterium]|nr:hypothetical protein [Candidatus Absconditabacterales bacterium]